MDEYLQVLRVLTSVRNRIVFRFHNEKTIGLSTKFSSGEFSCVARRFRTMAKAIELAYEESPENTEWDYY